MRRRGGLVCRVARTFGVGKVQARLLSTGNLVTVGAGGKKIPVKLYFDYKSPFSYLAKDPAYQLEKDYAEHITLEWLPFAFFVEEGFGIPETRSKWHWNKVKYAYLDARRWANSRKPPIVLYGPQKVYDSSTALMGGLYAMQRGKPVFYKYNDIVFEQFFKRKFDVESMDQVVEAMDQAASLTGHGQVGKDEWLHGFAAFAKKEEGEGWKRLREIDQQGQGEGVFGVPTFVVNGELFFGNDRVDWVRRRLDDIINKPCV